MSEETGERNKSIFENRNNILLPASYPYQGLPEMIPSLSRDVVKF